ncbi:hypothetical protein THRCLA_21253 [Thraustotheca clavata]|uniref:Phenazine biosynthesis protein PhzF n=1 Tax=Thraustotheca clavata TaxID=74557 RepID=A0A1V9ZYN1_9STRA|nr:hypothetical protein THRCLA_21253 [Thraustotheca clavata]
MSELLVKHYNSLLAVANALGGNKAGVAHVTTFPSDSVMQNVAKQVGFSETAFVLTESPEIVFVRFFTPEGEVDLCGHATIAVFSAMQRNTTYTMKTIKANLTIRVDGGGRVHMQQSTPTFEPIENPLEVQEILLSIGLKDTNKEIPITIASTGLRDIFIPVESSTVLHALKPNFSRIAEISTQWDTIGMHVYTLHPDDKNVTAECRNFAPRYAIDEEAATGSSSGALGAILVHHHRCPPSTNLVFSQGKSMQLPSLIGCVVQVDDSNTITRVEINGIAQESGQQCIEL